MTLRRRLFNIARAEIKSAANKIRRSSHELFGDPSPDTGAGSARDPRLGDEAEARPGRSGARGRRGKAERRLSAHDDGESPRIRRYYANLELPIGASVAEVKAAYRRLMRRYHPDLHQGDAERAEVANKLAKELRAAYEGLLAHLGKRSE